MSEMPVVPAAAAPRGGIIKLVKGPSQRPPRPLSPVAVAGIADRDGLIAFLQEMREEVGRPDDAAIERVAAGLAGRNGGIALVVRGEDGRIEGSMGIEMSVGGLSRACRLRTIWFAVLPQARLSGHARSLLLAARRFADGVGRPLLIEEMAAQPENPKQRLFARHFPEIGVIYLHQPAALE